MATKAKIKDDLNGSIFTTLIRGLGLGLSNFWRNKFLSAATITVMAVIILIFNVILGIQFIGNQALQTLSEHVDIVIYLKDSISFYESKKITDAVGALDGVTNVKYTSKDDAMQIVAKTHPKTAEFLQKFNLPNPLPPSISITTKNSEYYPAIEKLLGQPEYKDLMENYVTQGSSNESVIISDVAKNLANITGFVKQLIFWMILVFVLGGTLVVVNAIQLTIYTRRHEVYIMRLVGATPNFIRLPFILEGMLYGFFAVIVSFVILMILSRNIQIENTNLWTYFQNLELTKVFIFELALTLILGIISSFAAVEQYLKGKLAVH